MIEEAMEEITRRRPNPRWKKEDKTTISFLLGVGMSSVFTSRHQSTTWSRRKWFSTNLRISDSLTVDDWNISSCARRWRAWARWEMVAEMLSDLRLDLSLLFINGWDPNGPQRLGKDYEGIKFQWLKLDPICVTAKGVEGKSWKFWPQ
jgi:hypothetical protein